MNKKCKKKERINVENQRKSNTNTKTKRNEISKWKMAENMLFVFPSVNMEFKYSYFSVLSDIMSIKFLIC
jgi:hypothetical protein